MNSNVEKVVNLARRKGVLRPRDLAEIGFPRQYLRMAHERGLVKRIGRGLYSVPGVMLSEPTLAEVSKRVPGGVVCLVSALAFHHLTTQVPHSVDMAIGGKAHAPKIEFVDVRYYRSSGKAFTEGIETHNVGGVAVKVYDPAKTIADCFKYRNKIGLDVAIEALRDGLRQRKATPQALVRYGRICRVENVMRPYMEALLG